MIAVASNCFCCLSQYCQIFFSLHFDVFTRYRQVLITCMILPSDWSQNVQAFKRIWQQERQCYTHLNTMISWPWKMIPSHRLALAGAFVHDADLREWRYDETRMADLWCKVLGVGTSRPYGNWALMQIFPHLMLILYSFTPPSLHSHFLIKHQHHSQLLILSCPVPRDAHSSESTQNAWSCQSRKWSKWLSSLLSPSLSFMWLLNGWASDSVWHMFLYWSCLPFFLCLAAPSSRTGPPDWLPRNSASESFECEIPAGLRHGRRRRNGRRSVPAGVLVWRSWLWLLRWSRQRLQNLPHLRPAKSAVHLFLQQWNRFRPESVHLCSRRRCRSMRFTRKVLRSESELWSPGREFTSCPRIDGPHCCSKD